MREGRRNRGILRYMYINFVDSFFIGNFAGSLSIQEIGIVLHVSQKLFLNLLPKHRATNIASEEHRPP